MAHFRKIKSLKFLYEINEDGILRNVKSKKTLKGHVEKNGYVRVRIENKCLDRVVRTTIHQLVAECFVPNPLNKPFVNHIDSNRANNHYTNLEWVTHSENMKHGYKHGEVKKVLDRLNRENQRKILCIETNIRFDSITKASEWLVNNSNIKNIRSGISGIYSVASGKRKTFGGYKWKYI